MSLVKQSNIKNSRKLNQEINKLIPNGIANFVIGIGLLIMEFIITKNDPIINTPFAIVGIILGYCSTRYLSPGGRVNFHYYTGNTISKEEKEIDKIITKYRSLFLLKLTNIVLIILICTFSFIHFNNHNIINITNIVWVIFWTWVTMLMLGNGVKQISAWWNIKKYN